MDEAGAGVPAQDRVVDARRGEIARLVVPLHRLPVQAVGHATTLAAPLLDERRRPALGENARVISAIVFAGETRQEFLGLGELRRIPGAELVGYFKFWSFSSCYPRMVRL